MEAIRGAHNRYEDIGERMEAILSAPQHEDIVNLYSQIRDHRDFLHDFEKRRFSDTPLHSAARGGRTVLALEIHRLMPSFGSMLNSHGLSPLHLALLFGHHDTVSEMIKLNPELVRVQGKEGMTPLHYTVLLDNRVLLAEFLSSCPASIDDLTIRRESAVHLAVKERKFLAFQGLFGWLKNTGRTNVLDWRDCDGHTVLRLAESTNEPQVQNLLEQIRQHQGIRQRMEAMLSAPDDGDIRARMDAMLGAPAPEDQDIVNLYSHIREHRDFLHDLELTDTPLHSAARLGHTELALEIQRLMPSFGTTLNSHGLSPLHLALLYDQRSTVSEMVKLNPELVRVRGRMGMTPLHYAALVESAEFRVGDQVDLLAEFLLSCPESIDDLTIRGESAVHLAVKNRKLEAFLVLFGWLQKIDRTCVLGWRDCSGDTVLHLAASTDQPQVLVRLVQYNWRFINDKNSRGWTVLDILENMDPDARVNGRARRIVLWLGARRGEPIPDDHRRNSIFANCLSSKFSIVERCISMSIYAHGILRGEIRSAVLTVAVLIVATTYQAMLRPPSGISTAPNITINTFSAAPSTNATTNTNTALFSNITTYTNSTGLHVASGFATLFAMLNSGAFAASVGMIFIILPAVGRNLFLHGSLLFLVASYLVAMKLIYVEPYIHHQARTSWYVFAAVVTYMAANLLIKFFLLWVRPKVSVSRRLAGSSHFFNARDVVKLLTKRRCSSSRSAS